MDYWEFFFALVFGSVFVLTIHFLFYPPRLFFKNKSNKKEDELAPGIPRPNAVLAGMVATRILQHPENLDGTSDHFTSHWNDKKMTITRSRGVTFDGTPAVKYSVAFKGRDHAGFTESDLKKIGEAFEKTRELRKQMDAARERDEKEQEACNVIEELFGGPKLEPDCSIEEHMMR